MRSRIPFSWLWPAGLHFLWAQGNFGIGTTTPTERLDVEGGRLRVRAYSGTGTRLATVDPNGVFGTLSGNNPGEVLQWNGSAWVPTTISVSGDNWGSQTAVTAGPIQGNGTAGNPIILFPSTDFLFRRYQPPAHPLCGAGALKMSLLPFVGITSPTPSTLSPLLKAGEGRGEGGAYTHVPCPFGALLLTLYQILAKGF